MTATDEVTHETLLDHLADGVYFVDTSGHITYWNKGAERITGYTREDAMRQANQTQFLGHLNGSGEPEASGSSLVEQSMSGGQLLEREVYLKHKDGRLVPVFTRVSPITNSRGETIGALEVFSDNSSKLQALQRIEELEELALICPLTGVGNRRYSQLALQNAFEEKKRYGWDFGVLFVDIDRFKNINDNHGHAVGDDVLRMVAHALRSSLRGFDFVGRWGGEEFVVVLPNISEDVLRRVAERCRLNVEQSAVRIEGREIGVTISIGAALAEENETPEAAVERADRLMYESKRAGRNRVTMA